MKRIILCLIVYSSCANAVMIPFQGREGWVLLNLLFHQQFGRDYANAIFGDVPRFIEVPPLAQAIPDQNNPEREELEKEARRAQKLEARNNEKRRWLQSRNHNGHLAKKNKWVCQQSRSNNH